MIMKAFGKVISKLKKLAALPFNFVVLAHRFLKPVICCRAIIQCNIYIVHTVHLLSNPSSGKLCHIALPTLKS